MSDLQPRPMGVLARCRRMYKLVSVGVDADGDHDDDRDDFDDADGDGDDDVFLDDMHNKLNLAPS